MARTIRAGRITPGTILADGTEVTDVEHDPIDGCATVITTESGRRIGVASDTEIRIFQRR